MLFQPSRQVSHHLIVGHGAAGSNVLFACVDLLKDIDLILDIFKGGIIGQAIQQLLEELLGRHNPILSQLQGNWYPLIEEYRTADRASLVTRLSDPGNVPAASIDSYTIDWGL
jgi:hypothetical protein